MHLPVTEKLRYSIFHLRQHVTSINISINSVSAIKRLEKTFSSEREFLHLIGIIQTFTIAKIHTLFEEYQDHFVKEVSDIEFLRSLKMVLREIRKIAPDFDVFRNEIASHSLFIL
jgi:hypothetical protein